MSKIKQHKIKKSMKLKWNIIKMVLPSPESYSVNLERKNTGSFFETVNIVGNRLIKQKILENHHL